MGRAFPEGAAAIFGGSGGIGKGVALEFAKAGTDVAIFYRSKEAVAEAVADEIRALGCKASIHRADARSYDELEAGFAAAVEAHGRVHSIVWGAGPIVAQLPIADWTLEQFRASMEIEAFGFYHAARIAIPHFRASGGGSFVHLGSGGHDWCFQLPISAPSEINSKFHVHKTGPAAPYDSISWRRVALASEIAAKSGDLC